MVIASVIVGILFGFIWGNLFSQSSTRHARIKSTSKSTTQQSRLKASAWFLARTSVIRYLLLAAFLILLMKKYNLQLAWWLGGFLPVFWGMLVWSVIAIPQKEDN